MLDVRQQFDVTQTSSLTVSPSATNETVIECPEDMQIHFDGKPEEVFPELETSLRENATFSDLDYEGWCALLLGMVHDRTGNREGALEAYQLALDIWKATGNRGLEGTTANNIGLVYFHQGKYDKALELYKYSIEIIREVGDRAREGATLNNIALVYLNQSRYNKALEQFQQALEIIREEGDRIVEATIFNNIAGIYDNQGKYTKSLEYYQQALDIMQEVGYRVGEGTTLSGIGLLYSSQAKYEKALAYYEQALDVRREVGDRAGEGVTLNNIGSIYSNQGKYEQALVYYEQALDISHEVGDRAGEASILSGIGLVYSRQSKYEQALAYYEQALDIHREVGDRTGEGVSLNNMATVYDDQGKYKQALELYKNSLEIAREVGDRAGEGETLNNIGHVYNNQGKYEQALLQYQQALDISREVGDQAGEGVTLGNIATVYHVQGKYEQSIELQKKSLEISRDLGQRAREGTALNNIGVVYSDQEKYEQALHYFQQSLYIRREISDRAGEGITLNNIGGVYDVQAKYEGALEQYQQALEIYREVGNRASEGTALNNIGNVYHAQGKYEDALRKYQQALHIIREVGERSGEGLTLGNIGLLYEQQGQAEEALVHYDLAMDVFEVLRATAGSDQERASFIAQYAGLYQRAIGLYHEQGQDDLAYQTSERGRARSFLDSLATGYVQLSDDELQALLDQERETYDKRFAVRDQLARVRAQNAPDAEFVIELEKQLKALDTEYSEVQAEIEVRDDELAALVPGRRSVPTLGEVQARLDEETTLVSYWVLGEEGTLAFVMSRESLEVVELPEATPDNLSTMLQDLYLWTNIDDAHLSSLQQLHSWLVEPLAGHLHTAKVGIIPHQLLHYVPFAALSDGESYFGEQKVLFWLPSASALRFVQDKAKEASETDSQGGLVFGNPTRDEVGFASLSHAAKEAETVAALLGTSHYTKSDATETQLRQSVIGQKVVHLAAHGVYNRVVPLENTFIALAKDDEHDGKLQTGEVYGLKLKGSQLVTLSACQTQMSGLFDAEPVVSAGDEIVGLTRAFFFAGTPTVLSSLWNVDDAATGALMEAFYRNWQSGMGKAQALAAAQAEIAQKYPSPFFWAGFVLSGSPGEVTTSEATASPTSTTDAQSDAPSTLDSQPEATSTTDAQSETPSQIEMTWPLIAGVVGLLGLVVLGGMTLRQRSK